ncbi:putative adenosine monophosphate-protein transferase y4lH [Insulibacter thermoxylanivorax]|uniref:protein adenylyltransferase n=2 Tax=Insulibacter thermoxylanivorax TaxID=2749268 RepID=A0A916QHZ2_9BACL|nr:putative adenosine monophosphate-protein transferase y4lH [Insulibacter thermoxylanivorax]
MMHFNRSKQEENIYLSYHYPGMNVLKNKLDLRDPKDLEAAELYFTEERLSQPLPKEARELTYEGFLALHKHIFQDLYDWAGKPRNYTTGRGPIPFARPENIETWMRQQFKKLEEYNFLRGLSKDEFAEKAAEIVNEINAAHPFIEGNGRTQRVWLGILAEQAGYKLVLTNQDRERWYEASRIGFEKVDHKPMAALIRECLDREPQLMKEKRSIADRVNGAVKQAAEKQITSKKRDDLVR